jgi:hypothetical protein
MISVKINNKKFTKDMDNIIGYSIGFMTGVKRGQGVFLKGFGETVVEALKNYVDSNARVSPQLLHHMYEWNQTGSPDSRLFDISYSVNGVGLSFNSKFSQSKTIKDGSTVPFYDKARIMEEGIPVTIVPKNKVLAFTINDENIFSSTAVEVPNPGGNTRGQYEGLIDSFFRLYFKQSFLASTGILSYLENPIDFAKNFNRGKTGGYSTGLSVGARWIAKAGIL